MTVEALASIRDRSLFIEGGKTGILLIHGLGGTPVELRYVAQNLARAGFTVSCCHLAGHGGTSEELRRSTWHEWCSSVEEDHDRLKEHCDTIFAGGLSMGAILAIHLAQKRPHAVQGLLLLAPTLKLDGWSMPWHSRLLALVRPTRIPLDFDLTERHPYGLKDERVRALVVDSMQSGGSGEAGVFRTPLRSFANMNALVAAVKAHLGDVRQPALIVHPRDDDMASLRNVHYLQSHLAGRVETLVLDDSYHIITLDKQRDIVASASVSFVKGIVQNIGRSKAESLETERFLLNRT
jgi:carboxylesterase